MSENNGNYTKVPNILLDESMYDLTLLELQVMLYMSRKIFGFHRETWQRSYRKLAEDIGCTLANAHLACKSLVGKGILKAEDGGRSGMVWSVIVHNNVITSNNATVIVHNNATVITSNNNNKESNKEKNKKEKEYSHKNESRASALPSRSNEPNSGRSSSQNGRTISPELSKKLTRTAAEDLPKKRNQLHIAAKAVQEVCKPEGRRSIRNRLHGLINRINEKYEKEGYPITLDEYEVSHMEFLAMTIVERYGKGSGWYDPGYEPYEFIKDKPWPSQMINTWRYWWIVPDSYVYEDEKEEEKYDEDIEDGDYLPMSRVDEDEIDLFSRSPRASRRSSKDPSNNWDYDPNNEED
jgi:hypothetical protein